MNIGINALILKKNNTGTGYYTKSLIEEIVKNKAHNFYIFVKDKSLLNIEKENVKIIDIPYANKGALQKIISEQFLLKKYVKKYKIDLLHSTSFIIPFNIRHIPSVVTVHDMFHELFKNTIRPVNRMYYNIFFNRSIRKSDFIIADSENTKIDIEKILKIKSDKIKTVHLGLSKVFEDFIETDEKIVEYQSMNLPEKYILYVGSLEPRKNIGKAIEAYNLIKDKVEEKLVIVGARKWKVSSLVEIINKNNLEDKVIFTGYVDEKILPLVYKKSTLFLFPSLYEGFGFPVIEAMSMEVPVVTSNNSSLAEIAGESAKLINPNNIDEMADAVIEILKNKDKKDKMVNNGQENLKLYKWEKTAKETLEAYETAYKNYKK